MSETPRSGEERTGPSCHACWVGPTDRAETRHLWGWCKRRFAATHRDSLADLAAHPVPRLRNALVARTRREPLDRDAWSAAVRAHPLARWATLSGRLCEGEARTGEPWKGFARLRTCEGIDGIRAWLAEPSGGDQALLRPETLLAGVIATQYRFVEHIDELIRGLGGVALWSRPGEYAQLQGISILIIDDSALPAFTLCKSADPSRGAHPSCELLSRFPRRVAAIASLPCEAETQRWRTAGIDTVFPKPFRADHLARWLKTRS